MDDPSVVGVAMVWWPCGGCEAGDIVRLVARRRVGGDGEGRGHDVVPARAGRDARRLRPLLVRALQRGARLRARARAQR